MVYGLACLLPINGGITTVPTIREVAINSGVSTATVSRVLAGGAERKRCSAEAIRRVETVAAQLGYRVNYHMRSVRRKRSDAIGYITERSGPLHGNQAGDWYFEQLGKGVQNAAQKAGCMVAHVQTDSATARDRSALARGIQYVQERRLDGLILPGILSSFHGRLDDATHDNMPIVVIEPVDQTRWSCIYFDEVAGMQLILDHLLALNHRRLLWLGPAPAAPNRSVAREQAVLRAAFSAGVQGHCCFYGHGHNVDLGELASLAEQAVLDYLAGDPAPFTAIVAYNDLAAIGACRALARRGIRVPQDVSVTGFDDHCAALAWPPLTTVSHELFELGKRAGELVLEMIDANPTERAQLRQHRETMTPHLVIRESTAVASPLPS